MLRAGMKEAILTTGHETAAQSVEAEEVSLGYRGNISEMSDDQRREGDRRGREREVDCAERKVRQTAPRGIAAAPRAPPPWREPP